MGVGNPYNFRRKNRRRYFIRNFFLKCRDKKRQQILPEEKGKGVRIWRDGRQRHWAW